MQKRTLKLRAQTIRLLTSLEGVAGGSGDRPTSHPWCLAARATSEQGGDDFPCPGDYSYLCKP